MPAHHSNYPNPLESRSSSYLSPRMIDNPDPHWIILKYNSLKLNFKNNPLKFGLSITHFLIDKPPKLIVFKMAVHEVIGEMVKKTTVKKQKVN